jgi:hypothetical protein
MVYIERSAGTVVRRLAATVRIVETSEFQKDWKACISGPERHAPDLLLADDPSVGKTLPGAPGVLTLDCAGATIYFGVAPELSEVFLARHSSQWCSPAGAHAGQATQAAAPAR